MQTWLCSNMLALVLFATLFLNCKCAHITAMKDQPKHQNLTKCVTSIVGIYFIARPSFAYVDMSPDDDEILRELHSKATEPLVLRLPTARLPVRYSGYIITALNVEAFCDGFKDMLKDLKWNPSARFLIVIKSIKESELKTIFDVLLKQHVINVVVVNGTDDALLYTYNPFDHYACGRYYKHIEALGPCLQTDSNLFPNKLVTGLRNCTLRAFVPHQPPYVINPALVKKGFKIGAEQYALQLISEREELKVNYSYEMDINIFTTITPDMTIEGPLSKLYSGEVDVMFGNLFLVPTRAEAFTYITGYFDVSDQIVFLVKRSPNVPAWRVLFLVFQPPVWLLMTAFYLMFTIITIKLLGATVADGIALKLLLCFVGRSCKIPRSQEAQILFLIWIWFMYLMNSFYQSGLYSLITHPVKEYQIANENDLAAYNIKPCISSPLLGFFSTEYKEAYAMNNNSPACKNLTLFLETISKSNKLYTFCQKTLYDYYKRLYCDKYGNSQLYAFDKSFSKVITGIYFYKGFPVTNRMFEIAYRLHETGLIKKSITDQLYALDLKHKYLTKEFQYMIVIPWYAYAAGCILATIAFIIEVAYTKDNKT